MHEDKSSCWASTNPKPAVSGNTTHNHMTNNSTKTSKDTKKGTESIVHCSFLIRVDFKNIITITKPNIFTKTSKKVKVSRIQRRFKKHDISKMLTQTKKNTLIFYCISTKMRGFARDNKKAPSGIMHIQQFKLAYEQRHIETKAEPVVE